MFDAIVERPTPFPRGRHVFRAGTPFTSLYVVRSGVVATRTAQDRPAIARVTNFYLPGEIFGFVGICESQYQNDAIVLERATLCEIPFDALQTLSASLPAVQQRLAQLMSRMVAHQELFHNAITGGTAIERVALFVLDLARRRGKAGLSSSDLRIPLSRKEMGNFLGLALETVSRTLARLTEEQLITASRRHIRILDRTGLARLAGCEEAMTTGLNGRQMTSGGRAEGTSCA